MLVITNKKTRKQENSLSILNFTNTLNISENIPIPIPFIKK